LKNFCTPESDRVYCFDKKDGKSFPAILNDIAHENLFYGLPGAKVELEQGIAKVEGGFLAKPYKELLRKKNYNKISRQDKAWVCIFLGLQLMRSNNMRLAIKEMREKALVEIAKDELEREKGFKLPDGLRIRFTYPEYIKALHLDFMTRDGIETFIEFGNHFFNRDWVVLRNVTEIPLWTSDNPISFYNRYGDEGNLGIVSPGLEIRLPLSSKLLLFSYDPKTDPPHRNNDKMLSKMVELSNKLQVESSTRFIYSNSNDFDLAKKHLQKYPKYKNPDRSRFKIILKDGILESIRIS
jgi:hypothetical protein